MKRWAPVIVSMPTQPISSPIQADRMPLIGFLPTKTAMAERPNMPTQKYSAGPKARVTRASGGASVISTTALTMPPMAEETTAI